jgi:hypothetical protein
MRCSRGAVVVETALTVGIGLMILMFSIQVGVLGFLQITADAAAFETAHNQGLGLGSATIGLGSASLDTAGAADFTHQQFPQVATADITIASPSPAPTATLGMNYEYNVGDTADYNNRHSGESMLQPFQVPTTVKPHGMFTLLGKLIGVGAQDVEPEWMECTPHFNSAQAAFQQCGASSNPSGYSTNYFINGENTPMYYFGFTFMAQCNQALPWTSCPTADTQYLSMGSAEYLDTDNWAAANPGVSGSYTGYGTGNSFPSPTYTFEWMGCHANRIADIGFYFQHYPDLPSVYGGLNNGGGGGADLSIAKWLATKPTSFKTITSFAINPDPGMDSSIQEVYSWDNTVARGTAINASEPGTTAAYKSDQGNGCI